MISQGNNSFLIFMDSILSSTNSERINYCCLTSSNGTYDSLYVKKYVFVSHHIFCTVYPKNYS